MLWEAEPLPQTRDRLAAVGLRLAVFDPAGNRPATGDYFSVMRRNIVSLETAANAVQH